MITTQTITVRRRERAPKQADKDGIIVYDEWSESVEIQLDINVEQILREIGGRAVHNKNGTARFMHGLIKTKVLSRRVLQ